MSFADICFILKNFKKIISLDTEKKIAEILIKNNLKLYTAESCTGGLLSSRLTDVSGSSAYTFLNIVSYANDVKEKMLNVKHKSILNDGVVSYDVSRQMVKGLIEKYNADIAISTTGIAGPTGGTKDKPVGLVYISVGSKNSVKTYRLEANPKLSRRLMKYAFSSQALEFLLSFLKENYK